MSNFDFTSMLGNLLTGAGSSLGYGQMPVIQPRNRPQKKMPLPSEQAISDVHAGMNEAMNDSSTLSTANGGGFSYNNPVTPVQNNGGMLRYGMSPVSFHRYGGDLDPNAINVWQENGPETLVGNTVVPDNPDDQATALAMQNITPEDVQKAQMINREQGGLANAQLRPENYGLDQTIQQHPQMQGMDRQDAPPPMEVRANVSPAQQGQYQIDPNSVEGLQKQYQDTLQQRTKRSPWADLGVSLIQAGDNWFNHKNEPIKSWAELKTDRKLNNLGQRLGMAQSIEAGKTAAEQKAAAIAKSQADAGYSVARTSKIWDDMQRAQEEDKRKGNNWEPLITENQILKKFPDGHTEEFLNPATNKPYLKEERVTIGLPGMAGSVSVEPGKALDNATTIAVNNAKSQQSADETNAIKSFEALKTDVANAMKYSDDYRNALGEIAKANAAVLAASPAAQASFGNMQNESRNLQIAAQALTEATQKAQEKPDDANLQTAVSKAQENVWAIQDNIAQEQEKFAKIQGQSEGGQALAKAFQSAMPKRPDKVPYTPYKATQVTRGEAVTEDIFRQSLQRKGIPKTEWNFYIQQGKADGKIR